MILGTTDNLPVTAPQAQNTLDLLQLYRDFAQNINITEDDLYEFVTTPSSSRNEFFNTLDYNAQILSNRFISQTFG